MMISRVQMASTSSRMWVERMTVLAAAMLLDERADLVLLVGVKAVGGLVEHEHGRIVEQRLGEADALLESLGEGLDRLAADRSEVAELDDPVDRAAAAPPPSGIRGSRR